MKAVDDALINRVERAAMLRQLGHLEKAAASLRDSLGLVVREKFETVSPAALETDGITRMRTDQIDRLYETGKINGDQRAAALKFRSVWEAMGRGLFPGSGGGESRGTQSRGSFRHPLERMTDQEFFIWVKEYKPWANGPAAKTAIKGPAFQISYLQLCYAVVIDNFGPSQLERAWPISRGNSVVVHALRAGLQFWMHVDYDPEINIDPERDAILSDARKRLEHTRVRQPAA